MALSDFYKEISTPKNLPTPSNQTREERIRQIAQPSAPTNSRLLVPGGSISGGSRRNRNNNNSSDNVQKIVLEQKDAEVIQQKAVQGEQLRGSVLLRDGQKTAGDIYREYGYSRGGSVYEPATPERYQIREDYSPATKIQLAMENESRISTVDKLRTIDPNYDKKVEEARQLEELRQTTFGASESIPGGAQGVFTRASRRFDKVTETVDQILPSEEDFARFQSTKVGRAFLGASDNKILADAGYKRSTVIDVGSYFVPGYGQARFLSEIGRTAESGRYKEAVALGSIPYVAKFGTPVILKAGKKAIDSIPNEIKLLDLKQAQGLGLNKAGKARLSKAEIRFKTRTGFTKSEIIKGTKPSQSGTKTTTFYNKDIKLNTFLQTKLSGQDYKTLEQYKSFSIVKQPNKIIDNKFIKGQEIIFGKTKVRRGFTVDSKNMAPQSPSFQKTTKNVNIGLSNGDLTLSAKTKIKIKYIYDPITKKPKLAPKPILPNKNNPSNVQTIDLITNINKKGKEIYAPVNEPIKIIGGNRGGGRIRAELIAKAQAKRNAQLRIIEAEKEIIRQKNTLPSIRGTTQVYTYATNSNQKKSIEEVFKLTDPLMKKKLIKSTPNIMLEYNIKPQPALINVKQDMLRLPGSNLPTISKPTLQNAKLVPEGIQKNYLYNRLGLASVNLLKLRQEQKYNTDVINLISGTAVNKLKATNVLSLKAYQVPALAEQPAEALATNVLSQQNISSGTKKITKNAIEPISVVDKIKPVVIPKPYNFELPKKVPIIKYPTKFIPRKPINKVPNNKVPKLELPKNKKAGIVDDELLKSKNVGVGFQAFLKRKGKYFAISPIVKSKLSALDIGTLKAKQTLGATFKVEQVKGKPLDIKTSGEFSRFQSEFRDYAIRGQKKIKLNDTYIQKSRYRLGTQSEISEIQKAKRTKENQRWF